jgi:hypothetical protein
MGETGPEPVRVCSLGRQTQGMLATEFVQMTYCEFQNVCLLQFAYILTLSLQGSDDQVLQLIQTLVYPRTTFPFEHRLHNLRTSTNQ